MLGKGNGPAGEGRNRALEKGIWEGVEMWKGAVHLVFKKSLIENPSEKTTSPRLIDLD